MQRERNMSREKFSCCQWWTGEVYQWQQGLSDKKNYSVTDRSQVWLLVMHWTPIYSLTVRNKNSVKYLLCKIVCRAMFSCYSKTAIPHYSCNISFSTHLPTHQPLAIVFDSWGRVERQMRARSCHHFTFPLLQPDRTWITVNDSSLPQSDLTCCSPSSCSLTPSHSQPPLMGPQWVAKLP